LLVLFDECHCFTVHSLQLSDKTSPSIKKGKTLIDTIIWNIRRNISLTLLPIKGYTPNLASHKGREKNNKRNVRVGNIPHLPNTAISL
jgi:hypothetical protein